MTPAAAAARKSVQTRNATEEAILAAARDALDEKGFGALTMDTIAKRASSRAPRSTSIPQQAAVVDRLIQQAFSEMYLAASPYLDGEGDDVRRELRTALARVVGVVNRNGAVLLLAAQLTGARGEHLPSEWARTSTASPTAPRRASRATRSAASRRPTSRRASAAQALLAMVENHITREIVLDGGDAPPVDPRARRAVVARGVLAP